jgi:hypothetical protein
MSSGQIAINIVVGSMAKKNRLLFKLLVKCLSTGAFSFSSLIVGVPHEEESTFHDPEVLYIYIGLKVFKTKIP